MTTARGGGGIVWLSITTGFLVFLVLTVALYAFARKIQAKQTSGSERDKLFMCGESDRAFPPERPTPRYRLYHYALAFSIAHIAVLLIALNPLANRYVACLALAIMLLAVACLLRR